MNSSLLTPLLITLGAIPGALSRYYLTLFCTQKFGSRFPYGTLIINLSGSLFIGFCAALFQSIEASKSLSLLVMIGFLGSYTTFSTYQLETSNFLKTRNYKKAFFYGLGSPVLGFIFVEFGIFLARQL